MPLPGLNSIPSLSQISNAFSLPDNIMTGDGGSTYYRFPLDVLNPKRHSFFITFSPYSEEIAAGSKGDPKARVEQNELPPVFLQLPTGFVDEYGHSYTEEPLLLNFREIAAGGGRAQLPGGGVTGSGGGSNAARTIQAGAIRKGVELASSLPGATSAQSAVHGSARGAIENLYDRPQLRTWTMNFVMKPRNPAEEIQTRLIILHFMALSAPTYNAVFQRYPAIFDIGLASIATNDETGVSSFVSSGMNNTIVFTKCGLRKVHTNYDPTGQMLLSEEGHPVVIEFQLEFIETRPLDRETILRHMQSTGGGQTSTGRFNNQTAQNALNNALGNRSNSGSNGVQSIFGGG